jgi:hypothetical protein
LSGSSHYNGSGIKTEDSEGKIPMDDSENLMVDQEDQDEDMDQNDDGDDNNDDNDDDDKSTENQKTK